MERPARSFSEEALGEFSCLKDLLSGTKTPSDYMRIIIDGYKRNKRQKEYFYAGFGGVNDRIEDKLKKIREEIKAHLRHEQPKFPAQKSDTRFIYDSMLVAEANELTEGNFETPKEKIEVRLAGFGLNINNLDLNVEIGIIMTDKNNFCFFYRDSSTDTTISRTRRDYTNFYPFFRMNPYDFNLASWIVNTYKEASLIPQPNGTPPHSFAFPNL